MGLEIHLKEIGRYPILSRDEEVEVARRSIAGDQESRHLLINSNLRLVVSVAKKYSRNGTLGDLVGEGNLALVEAARVYNPDFGVKFSTYAYKAIEQRIWKYLAGESKNNCVNSLDEPVGDDATLSDFFVGEDGRENAKNIFDKNLRINLRGELDNLPVNSIDKEILERVLFKGQDFKIIAESLDIEKDKVVQLYSRGLRIFRWRLKEAGFGKFFDCKSY